MDRGVILVTGHGGTGIGRRFFGTEDQGPWSSPCRTQSPDRRHPGNVREEHAVNPSSSTDPVRAFGDDAALKRREMCGHARGPVGKATVYRGVSGGTHYLPEDFAAQLGDGGADSPCIVVRDGAPPVECPSRPSSYARRLRAVRRPVSAKPWNTSSDAFRSSGTISWLCEALLAPKGSRNAYDDAGGRPIQPDHAVAPTDDSLPLSECLLTIRPPIRRGRAVVMQKAWPGARHVSRHRPSPMPRCPPMEGGTRGRQGFANPAEGGVEACPIVAASADWLTSHTSLANVDLTSRCNLRLPICFRMPTRTVRAVLRASVGDPPAVSSATAGGRLLRCSSRAASRRCIRGFSTSSPRAKALGFSHIQRPATGVALARSRLRARRRDAGLQYIYLQMDGNTDDVFRHHRGKALRQHQACGGGVRATGRDYG